MNFSNRPDIGNFHRYMRRQGEQQHITENYVSSPPALAITDGGGNVWCLGMVPRRWQGIKGDLYSNVAFDVVVNGKPTGELASRIECRNGEVYIFGVYGGNYSRKHWTGRDFV